MKRLITALLTLLLANSCATVTPEPITRTGGRLASPSAANLAEDVVTETSTDATVSGIDDIEIYPGNGSFINENAARRPASVVSEDGEIVLNFEGESVMSVVHTILGEVLQETFVIGPGVSGQVTFSTSKPVTRDQLMPILELLLRWNGATLVYSEGRYHVLPVSDAVRGHLVPSLGEISAVRGYDVRVVPLKYISATEMAKILEPYLRDGALINVDIGRSMLFLAGTREELTNYLQTVEIFDVDWLAGMSVGIFPLQTVDVQSITTELMSIFASEGESPLAGMFRFVPLERLGSLLVITPQEAYLDKAEEWITRLDRGAAGSGEQLFVYRVQNLEAQVLAGYLTQLFGGTTSQPSRQGRGTLAPGLEPVTTGSVSDFGQNRMNTSGGFPQSGFGGGGGSGSSMIETEDGQIRITSVLETNSLLIQATQAQYASLKAAIKRIDQEPLQVLIESQVLDVSLTEDLAFGVNWFLTNNPDLIPPNAGNPAGRYIDTVEFGAGLSSGTNFLSTISRPLGDGTTFVQVIISALDSVTDVRSVAAPSLLVRNNATATITVGEQVPVQSSSISTGNDNVVSSAQYVSTGVTLTVTPRINPGGLVYMDITQEVSRPGARDPEISTSGNPPISTKSVNSQVAVQSGETIFLGGLISEQSSEGRTGVPYLSRIPVIGSLFGSKTISKVRSETLVMITPTVIENFSQLREVTDDLLDEFKKISPLDIATIQD
jgi:general secretion pathway protein D